MNHKVGIVIAISLIVIVFLSLFLLFNWGSSNQTPGREFYVGVEYAYGNQSSEVIALVDKVKDYTNLFVFGAEMTSDSDACLTYSKSFSSFMISSRCRP